MYDDDELKHLVAQAVLSAINKVAGATEIRGEQLTTALVYEGLGEAFIAFSIRDSGFDRERLSRNADQFVCVLRRTVSKVSVDGVN